MDSAERLAKVMPMFERTFARWVQGLLEEGGVSHARIRLLGVLNCKGPMTMRCVSAELNVTARNVTALVDGLESEGLVRRVPHPTDRRATVIELTAEGSALGCRVLGPFHAKVAGLFRELSPEDQGELLRIMESLLASLQKRARETEACSDNG